LAFFAFVPKADISHIAQPRRLTNRPNQMTA
jgi:hypothetical protein